MCLVRRFFSYFDLRCVGLVLSFFFLWLLIGILFLVLPRLDYSFFLFFFFAFFGCVAVPVAGIFLFCSLVFLVSVAMVFLVCCSTASVVFFGLVPGGVGSLSSVPLLHPQLRFCVLSFLGERCFFVFAEAFLAVDRRCCLVSFLLMAHFLLLRLHVVCLVPAPVARDCLLLLLGLASCGHGTLSCVYCSPSSSVLASLALFFFFLSWWLLLLFFWCRKIPRGLIFFNAPRISCPYCRWGAQSRFV